jgi:hypothetical protein
VSVNQTALYIADAPSQLIELSARHTTHDWAYALSELGRMAAADELAWILQGAALTCIFLGMGVSAWGAVRVTFEGERAEHVESFLEGRPVVGPGNYDEWMQQEAPDPSTEETAPPGSG